MELNMEKFSENLVDLEKKRKNVQEDSHMSDFIQDKKDLLMELLSTSTLTEREQKIIRLRYGLDDGRFRSLAEVAKEFNVTSERIRQIEAKALRRAPFPRYPGRSRKLPEYLD